jgi:hypothetical protein
MNILRYGSTHGSPTRYIDLLKREDVNKVVWVSHENDNMVKSVFDVCAEMESELIKKMKHVTFRIPYTIKFFNRLFIVISTKIPRFSRILGIFEILFFIVLKMTNFSSIKSLINSEEIDFIWSGNNDSDGINILLWWLRVHLPKISIIHSYQEHRCKFRLDEKMAIKSATKLILPSKRNKESFEKIYNLNLSENVVYGNEDWRSKDLIEYVHEKHVIKKSELDKEPHVIILTRFATYTSETDLRRGSRINYLNLIETLVKLKIHVHLNCLKIVKTIGDQANEPNNPYFQLEKKYPTYFHIDKPINLKTTDGYLELKSYDAGILHNVVEGEKINLFSNMNVPNRLFEYLLSDVESIMLKGHMDDVEEFLRSLEFGVVENNYKDVADKLYKKIGSRNQHTVDIERKLKYSFENFCSILINEITEKKS